MFNSTRVFPIGLLNAAMAIGIALSGCQASDENQNNSDGSNASFKTGDDTSSETDSDASDRVPVPICPIPTELQATDVLDIALRKNDVCFPERHSWNPASQTSNCHLVIEYEYGRNEYTAPPECPVDDGQQWIEPAGELTEKRVERDGEMQRVWIRQCMVNLLAAPIRCADMAGNAQYADYDSAQFGWYYCENPGEDNLMACSDELDNDRDGKTDADDSDCAECESGGDCSTTCPYSVVFTESAAEEAVRVGSATIVCLKQYDFEEPNCDNVEK